jgi:hypothetical protein
MERLTGWQYQARKIREKEAAEKAANPGPDLREAEVVEMGIEIDVSDLSGRSHAGIIAKYALTYGWDVKAGQSKYRSADRMWNGEVKEGEIKTHTWCQGVSPDRKHHFTISTGLKLFDGWPVDSLEELKVGIYEHGNEALPAGD